MAGFMVVWTDDGALPDPGCLALADQLAHQDGATVQRCALPGAALLAWRRQAGEFPFSGRLVSVGLRQLAWIGQCVSDAGDDSPAAMQQVAAEQCEDDRLSRLNGPFAAVALGSHPSTVRIVTDRHRHYPVYLHRGQDFTVASTEMRCILPWLAHRRIDRQSVDMLLRCGELIDRRTLLRDVELLPPATVFEATIAAGRPARERTYWAMRHDGSGAPDFDATAGLLAARLDQAVKRLEAVSPRAAITLSGGLDSRIILDLCSRPARVPSFTWGLPGCRDIDCAVQYARRVGSAHTVRHWEPEAFVPLWRRGVDLTAGSFGIESMHMLPFIGLLSASADMVFNGLAGDALLGGNFLRHRWLTETDVHRLGGQVWRWRVTEAQDSWGDRLMRPDPQDESAQASWIRSIAERQGGRPVERVNDWLYANRVFRYTNAGTMLLRSGIESHAPFFDRDFVDAALTARPEHKLKHRLYLAVMQRAAPRAAAVRWQRTNLPPAWGHRANLASMAWHRVAGRVGATLGIAAFPALKVADPAGWMRGPWRSAIEDILFQPRAVQRGLWDGSQANALWRAHLEGADHTRQIAAMVAIELFARQAVDREHA